MSFDASAFLQTVPESPGVYRMIGADETVLYVGKAKNLRRRLASYFRTRLPSPRIALMVRQIERVDISLVRSEAEALILENHLIKTLSPRYNILFRDDKSYPYIRLTGGDFPAIQTYRGALHKGERYFGPYPNGWAARESIQLVQKLFELRTCADSVFRNRSRPCLLHQIHRCTAPCVGKVSVEEYRQQVEMAARFLSGKSTEVIETLTAAMNAASERLDFEEAARLRDRLRALQSVLHQQAVDSRRDEDVDILVVIAEGGLVCVNLAMVRGGRHLGDRPLFPQQAEGAEPADVLHAFLEQHYQDRPWPDRILTNLASPELAEFVEFLAERPIAVSTGRGATDRAWLEMAEANARVAIAARLRGGERARTQLQELAAVLDLPEPPRRIECFDISHTMGEATVASCVVWEGDGMNPSQYRRYHIEGITPGDDYAAMRQVLTRRYERVAEGEAPRLTSCSSTAAKGSSRSPPGCSTNSGSSCRSWAWPRVKRANPASRRSFSPTDGRPCSCRRLRRRCISSRSCATRRTASPSPATAPAVPNRARARVWKTSPASAPNDAKHCSQPSAGSTE